MSLFHLNSKSADFNSFQMSFFGPLFTLLTFAVTASTAAPLKDYEKKALSLYSSQQYEMGYMQNPPIGSVSDQARAIEKHVRETLLKFKPDFFEKYQLSIGVYPSLAPNAFMSRVRSSGTRLVHQKFYGFDTKKPVYHLGITYGLYRTLTSLDEVEAVISHEAIHLLEGHVDERPEDFESASKHWYSSERYEAVTDHMALELMLGHVDLDALRDALWTLAEYRIKRDPPPSNEWSQLLEAVGAAVSSHHDRGLRIGSVQAQAEILRTKDKRAQPRARRTIPTIMRGSANPRPHNNDSLFTAEQRERYANLVVELTRRITQQQDKEPNIISHLLRKDSNTDLNTPENRFATKMSPDETSITEIAKIIQQTILNNNSLSREQKVAQLWLSHDMRNRRDDYGLPFEIYLQNYAKAIVQAIGGQSVDWQQIAIMTHESANDFITSSLGALIYSTTEGRKLYRMAFRTLLFNPQGLGHGWKATKPSKKFEFYTLSTILLNYPFVYRHNLSEKAPAPWGFQNYLKRLFLEELDRLTPMLESSDFRKLLFSSDPDSPYKEFMSFVSGRINEGRQQREDPIIKTSKFLKAADALYAEGVQWAQQQKNQLLGKISSLSKSLSTQDLNDLSEFFSLSSYASIRKDEGELLGKIYFNALDTYFHSPLAIGFGSVEPILEHLIQTDAVPLGTREQNIQTLWALALSGLHEKEEHRIHGERLLTKLVAILGIEQLKALMLAAPSDIFERRFQQELNSEKYQKNKREYQELHDQFNDPNLPIFKQMEVFSNLSFKKMYFQSHDGFSSQGKKTTFGILSLLNSEVIRSEALKSFTLADIDRTIRSYYFLKSEAARRKKIFEFHPPKKKGDREIDEDGMSHLLGNLGHTQEVSFLLKGFAQHQGSINDLKTWAQMYRSLLAISSASIDTVPELKEGFEKRFLELSRNGQDPQAYLYIRGPHLRKGLSELALVPILFEEFKRRANGNRDATLLRQIFVKLDEEQKLKSDLTDVYDPLRERIAEEFRLQPDTIEKVFPDSDTKINTKNTEGLDGEIRGISGVTSFARQRSFEEQLQLMEYLMGRRADFPNFISKWQKDTNHPITSILYGIKLRLSRESDVVRAFTLNTLMTGPDGFAEKPGAEEFLLDYFFKDSENQSIAREIAQALLNSLGRDKSFAYAYVLAQKTNGTGKLNEGEILKALLEVVFGVPGKKLGQYLAFVGELGALREALAKLQDSASPLSYLDILKLVNRQMGLTFTEKYEVVRALGSGSVNIAIEILAKKLGGEARVISVLRESIEIAAANDFRRLQSLVGDLAQKNPKRYGFLPGLLKIIQKSVSLEFDKANSMERQKAAGEIYRKQVNGWTLKAPAVYNSTQLSLEMEKANGKTAVKIRKLNFPVYQEAMRIVLEAEFDHLMNSHIIFGRKLTPLAFANPDLHDGQVIIDIEKKTITILDFGQAVSITRQERDLGLMTIRMLVQTEDANDFAKQILKLQKAFLGKAAFSAEEIKTAFEKKDLMDRFIYFLGIAGNHNWEVSIATVHFILGINRLNKLGDVIGYDLSKRMATILKVREFTKSTELGATIDSLLKSMRKDSGLHRTCKSIFQ